MTMMVKQIGILRKDRNFMIDNFKGKYFFLSNSSPSEIKEEFKDGTLIIYPTVEHAFQATKTRDIILRKQIALCSTPRMAKRLAEHISLREDWDEIQLSVMFSCIPFLDFAGMPSL